MFLIAVASPQHINKPTVKQAIRTCIRHRHRNKPTVKHTKGLPVTDTWTKWNYTPLGWSLLKGEKECKEILRWQQMPNRKRKAKMRKRKGMEVTFIILPVWLQVIYSHSEWEEISLSSDWWAQFRQSTIIILQTNNPEMWSNKVVLFSSDKRHPHG